MEEWVTQMATDTDTDYTVLDDEIDDTPADDGGERIRPPFRVWAPYALIGLGVVLALLAGWMSTARFDQFSFDGQPPGKGAFFKDALALPLSIAGALLFVAGILLVVLRYWSTTPASSHVADGTDEGEEQGGATA